MRIALVLAAALGCNNWTHKDTALEAAFFVATTLDWQQTAEITSMCDEINPIMGACGQRIPVGVYFPVLLMAHAAIASVLPPSWRSTFQGLTVGMEATTTYWNNHTGIR
jgi:hypothetical protein